MEKNQKITVKSTLSGDDYSKVTMFGAFTKSRLLPFVLCLAVPIALLQIFEVINSGAIHNKFAYYGSVFMLSMLIFMYIMVKMSIRNVIKNDKVTLNTERTFLIGEKSLTTVASDKSKHTYAYGDFLESYEINGYFLLYVDKMSGIIITKRDMESSDIEEFRNILRNAFGKKFYIRGKK